MERRYVPVFRPLYHKREPTAVHAVAENVLLWALGDRGGAVVTPAEVRRAACGRYLSWLGGVATEVGREVTCGHCLRQLKGCSVSFELSGAVERELALRRLG